MFRLFRRAVCSPFRRTPAPRANAYLKVESLEERATPATFGVAWTDARHLTLSFAPDGTSVAGQASTLFTTMNANAPTATWEKAILEAFQAWASQANINITIAGDGGQPFGAPGAAHADPRFGDIRIGAIPMSPEALSVSVPHDPFMSGTWAGDMLINSAVNFGPNGADLFTVALHEAGHVFGLDENNDPTSAMYAKFNGVKTHLSASDVTAIRALYGCRTPDQYEGSSGNGNGTINAATQLQGASKYVGSAPVVVFGDVTTLADVDYYMFRSPSSGYSGPVTVRVQSAGRSLLAPKVTVYDAAGRVLGQAISTSHVGDTLFVHLNGITPNSNYFIRIEAAKHDVCGVGSYGLAVTYDALLTTPAGQIDVILRGPYDSLTPSQLQSLFADSGAAVNDDLGADDTLKTATRLATPLGFAPNSHFEAIGSISPAGDVDSYTFRSPQFINNTSGVLTATVWALDSDGAAPQIDVFDRNRNLVPAMILANGNGTYTVQVTGIESGRDFYLEIHAKRDGGGVGNYGMNADFGAQAAVVDTFASGTLTPAQPAQQYNLYVAESQLFQLLLSAQGAAGQVRLTVFDGASRVVATLTGAAGDTVSGPGTFLKPGTYRVLVEGIAATGPLTFAVTGINLIDPIGPVASDPTAAPQFTDPTTSGQYVYPDGTITTNPFLWALLLV